MPKKPPKSLTMRSWEELMPFVEAFARKDKHRLNLLILVGNPGLGKSRIVRDALSNIPHCNVEGHATAFQLYTELFWHRNEHVIIDDVDSLLAQRSAVPLLKCLCQTDAVKTVQWNSAASQLAKEGIPTKFQTASTVCIIANGWERLNINIGAVQDRGTLIFFEPSAEAVHERAGHWFKDREIYKFIGEHLEIIAEPTFRDYVTAQKLKANNLNWRSSLLELWVNEDMKRVWVLEKDRNLPTVEDKVAEFERRGWGSRATYFRHKQKLKK